MPDILLSRSESDGQLPRVCMCCGKPATEWITRTFLARPPTVNGPSGFMEIYAIRFLLAYQDMPRFTLRTSFCEEHRNYWYHRSILMYGGLAGMFAALLVGFVITALLMTVGKVDAPWLSCCAGGPFILYFIAWIIPFKLVMDKCIRAWLMEDEEVLLQNVAEDYIDAVMAARSARPVPPPLPGAQKPAGSGPPPLPGSAGSQTKGRPGPPPLPDSYGRENQGE